MKQTRTIRVLHYSLAPLSCGGGGGGGGYHSFIHIAAALLRSDTFSKITSPSYPELRSYPARQHCNITEGKAGPCPPRRRLLPILGCHKLVRQAKIAILFDMMVSSVIRSHVLKAAARSGLPRAIISTAHLPPPPPAAFLSKHDKVGFSSGTAATATRPFQILGLQQIAVGSLSKESMTNIWIDVFGISKLGTYKSEKENVDEDILKIGPKDSPYAIEVDLMTPLDPDKIPKVHAPPLNHIGLWVDDLPSAVAWMADKGVRFTPGGIRKGAAGHDVTFIHPKGNESAPIGGAGVLIELVQAPPDVIDALKA